MNTVNIKGDSDDDEEKEVDRLDLCEMIDIDFSLLPPSVHSLYVTISSFSGNHFSHIPSSSKQFIEILCEGPPQSHDDGVERVRRKKLPKGVIWREDLINQFLPTSSSHSDDIDLEPDQINHPT